MCGISGRTTVNGLYEAIKLAASGMHLESWLLYLNFLLHARRQNLVDPLWRPDPSGSAIPPHIVHFLAQVLVEFGSNHGGTYPSWDWFADLRDTCMKLRDPAQDDPNWDNADPSAMLIRLFNQQFPAQETRRIQQLGLASGLYCDLPPLANGRHLKAEIEKAIDMPLEAFIALGACTMTFAEKSHAGHKCSGTFTPEYLSKADAQGINACSNDYWKPFLKCVAIRPSGMQRMSVMAETSFTCRYPQYAFNLLRVRPVIETHLNRYVAPDPYLIGERTTLGLFYDGFEKDKLSFVSDVFGPCFERFVEDLIRSAVAGDMVWTPVSWDSGTAKRNAPSKHVDVAVRCGESLVLVECKSARSSVTLTTEADEDSIESMCNTLAKALLQAAEHAQSIRNGDWEEDSLSAQKSLCVIVTYGKFHAVNTPWVRRRVLEDCRLAGHEVPPWVVLSIDQFDALIGLVEDDASFGEAIAVLLSEDDISDPLQHHFGDRLRERAISSYTFNKGKAVLNSLTAGSK